MSDDDLVLAALANASRRQILDLLLECDGRTISDLELHLPMSRFGVRKHLAVLHAAGLITARVDGRRTLHYLRTAPIDRLRRRWIGKYLHEEPICARKDMSGSGNVEQAESG